jgi:hypothetical protein
VEFGLLYNYVKKEIERKHTFMYLLPHSKKKKKKKKSNLFVIFFWVGSVCGATLVP